MANTPEKSFRCKGIERMSRQIDALIAEWKNVLADPEGNVSLSYQQHVWKKAAAIETRIETLKKKRAKEAAKINEKIQPSLFQNVPKE